MSRSELYQELILDHNRSPRNFRAMPGADRKVEGYNPLCGDRLTIWLKLDGGTVADLSFEGQGCAVSRAAASLMTAAVKGRSRAEAEELADRFTAMVTGRLPADAAERQPLGKLAVFEGVAKFPLRVKCATLAWHALRAGLRGEGAVTTE
ncbi:MAG TPA: SUF system NifU family Fe-S cluster assembly protein [Gemmatimonadales bacterium]|nr:SUF system NifU family Fe-S cluster assembly protein [Gemmatimonadales bacterium]